MVTVTCSGNLRFILADKLLQNCKPGSFVIRDSNSRPGSYSLVMKTTQSYVDPGMAYGKSFIGAYVGISLL